MLNTFENAETFHHRRLERERHMANMDIFSNVIQHDDEAAILSVVDALSGFPLAKKEEVTTIATKERNHFRLYTVCSATAVLLIIVSILSAWGGMNKEEKAIATELVNPSASRDLNPRFQRIFSLILDWGFTPRSQLEIETSASRKALNWLVEVDTDTFEAEDIRARYALASLYFGTQNVSDGFVWTRSMHWLSEFPVCLWYGVYCHDDEWIRVDRVGGLNLSSNGLVGHLPEELGLLGLDIHSLDVSNNFITGKIPTSIGLMKNLRHLYLGSNLLTGTLPKSIAQINILQRLFIEDCLLTGTIPTEMAYLQDLQAIGLHENAFTGTIPGRLNQLSQLVVLYLDGNSLIGTLPPFPTSLVDLRLRQNMLSGSIPSQLGLLNLLQTCYLDTNCFVGTIPEEFANLRFLQELHLYNNYLTGSVPSLFQFQYLRILYLDGNHLGGTLSPQLGLMQSIESLFIFDNLINGSLPASFVLLTDLEQLVAHTNALSGVIPEDLGNLSKLKVLKLQENHLTGSVPPSLGALPLTELQLHWNQIEGDIPSTICKLTQISLRNLTADCADNIGRVGCKCCSACY
ncbi:RHS repeat-associated core domain containing protein [Nitzschia inconspicua]|uniref:RHS repeat-associated core domain containing protein n=1 Tax=Nitzschia inconspicua TaxID=303405 RepID=A0A9K3L196_9STRA|nr:RHS repeat-associated core domain containing protein [Nitzschia inconspicua]